MLAILAILAILAMLAMLAMLAILAILAISPIYVRVYYSERVPCVVFLLVSLFPFAQPSATCADVVQCRQAALDAASRGEFEAFHDLAWRAAQKGRPNDPELMYLLARAQSLSGRPGDALVMLRRLGEMGLATDARESDDFKRVRALPGWGAIEGLLTAVAEKRPAAAAIEASRTPAAAAPPTVKVGPKDSPSAARPGSRDAAAAPGREPAPAATLDAGEDALGLADAPLAAVGLAYDGASRRFVVGDGRANKLMVADEVFKRVNDLIGAASAGFGMLTGVEIDGRRGDLWVTSTAAESASVHKLQLVSGRVLSALAVPEEQRPAVFDDFAVAESGGLLLIDSAGARLFSVKPGAHGFDKPVALRVPSPVSIAPSRSGVYVAHRDGLCLADRDSGRATDVRASDGVTITGLRRIRSVQGDLVAIQAGARGVAELVRIRLGSGGKVATAVVPLDNHREADGSALTISRDAVYYIARTPSGPTIRRVPLR
jgi:hypothetical protein